MNCFVYFHFDLLKDDLPQLSRFQKYLSVLLAWWSVPITLIIIWMGYLRRHDSKITFFIHISITLISLIAGSIFYCKMVDTLQGAKFRNFFKKDFWQSWKVIVCYFAF